MALDKATSGTNHNRSERHSSPNEGGIFLSASFSTIKANNAGGVPSPNPSAVFLFFPRHSSRITIGLSYTSTVTEKCDVYSFGVVVLEVMMGKHARDLLDHLASSRRQHLQLLEIRKANNTGGIPDTYPSPVFTSVPRHFNAIRLDEL
ncbi:uncharacterized protein LOC133903241 [Phragmites australis]|uniref:uncharacterized protein LOC133903241 n=1 Tax=Phragmites australis TaxID=29695 RepID=UPI002D7988E2|nr:uncharacterized protein LOC133903241 [Phragmites australis]